MWNFCDSFLTVFRLPFLSLHLLTQFKTLFHGFTSWKCNYNFYNANEMPKPIISSIRFGHMNLYQIHGGKTSPFWFHIWCLIFSSSVFFFIVVLTMFNKDKVKINCYYQQVENLNFQNIRVNSNYYLFHIFRNNFIKIEPFGLKVALIFQFHSIKWTL